MAVVWNGGFETKRLTRDEYRKYVAKQPKQKWIQWIVVHNTGAPNMEQARHKRKFKNMSDAFDARQASFENYYRNEEHWKGGPHAFTYEDGLIGKGTPITKKGTHSPQENSFCIGVEMVADFRKGEDNPTVGGGYLIYDTAAFVVATWLRWLGLKPNNKTIRLHKENRHTDHDCPGNLIVKADFLKRVQAYYEDSVDESRVVVATKPNENAKPVMHVIDPPVIGSVKEIQAALSAWGYDIGPIDGDQGKITTKAIEQFQERMGVDTSGKVGPWIWKKLKGKPQDITPTYVEAVVEAVEPTVIVEFEFKPDLEEEVVLGPDELIPPTPAPEPKAPSEPVVVANPNKLTGKDRPHYVKSVLEELGWKSFQAAAIVGNLMRESYPDLKTDAWGDKSKITGKYTAYGIAQWRDIHNKQGHTTPGRLAHLENFARTMGKPKSDLEVQAKFVDWELRNNEKAVGDKLKRTDNLMEALRVAIGYERPRGYTPNDPERGDGWKERLIFATSLL